MSHGRSKPERKTARWYRGKHVPLAVIRRFAREVGRQFHPQKVILFGSRAQGTPHADSDVDILVIMPARNQLDQAVKIEQSCDPPFPLDILVRTPEKSEKRLREGDSLLREVMATGKVLYEEDDARVGSQRRSRPSRGAKALS